MREKNDIHSFTASIVTYSKKRRELEECTNTYKIMQKLIEDLLSNEACEWIAVIDNSKDKIFEPREDNKKIIYTHMHGRNLGYGKGHNEARKIQSTTNREYHLIINADVVLEEGGETINKCMEFLKQNPEIGIMQPLIMNEREEDHAEVVQKNPTLLSQIIRFGKTPEAIKKSLQKYNEWYECKEIAYRDAIVPSQYLSGCFLFAKLIY